MRTLAATFLLVLFGLDPLASISYEPAPAFAPRCNIKAARVSNALPRRDDLRNSDIISIYIDPYHDRTTGYNFRVNLYGVVADAYMFNDVYRDWNWDTVWQVETSTDTHGWSTEFRIPLSSIRYRAGDNQTWGLQIFRWMPGRGEGTGRVCYKRDPSGFVSRFGTLSGL